MAETKLRTVRGGKSKPKAKPRKITQKTKYVFNRQIKETAEYTRYFSAEGEAEHLGLINWVCFIFSLENLILIFWCSSPAPTPISKN